MQPAREIWHLQLRQLLSICYIMNFAVLKLFGTSDLAICAKVVQRLL